MRMFWKKETAEDIKQDMDKVTDDLMALFKEQADIEREAERLELTLKDSQDESLYGDIIKKQKLLVKKSLRIMGKLSKLKNLSKKYKKAEIKI